MLAGCARSAPAPVVLKGLAPPPKSASTAEEVGIVVDRGDTLYSVAGRANTSVRGLIEANGLTPPYVLAVGRTLRVPRSRFHTVAAGDTVYAISRRYGLDMFSLVRANGLKPPHTITIGQRLRLPRRQRGPGAGPSWRRPGRPRRVHKSHAPPPATPSVPRDAAEFSWPVNGRILSEFGPKPGGLHNDGINIAVARGMPVRVARTGVVVYAGNELRGFGHLLLVRHDGGWMTAYAHKRQATGRARPEGAPRRGHRPRRRQRQRGRAAAPFRDTQRDRSGRSALVPAAAYLAPQPASMATPRRPAKSWMNCQPTRPERAPRVCDHSIAWARRASGSISRPRCAA